MKKSEMIAAIENAKLTHQEQMHKIELVISGEEVENPTPVSKIECQCGEWFNGNREAIIEILGLQLYERLDKSHEKWHLDYVNIYNLFFKEEKKKGLMKKLFSFTDNREMKVDKAKLYYIELKKDTEELLNITESALRRVSALSNTKFS